MWRLVLIQRPRQAARLGLMAAVATVLMAISGSAGAAPLSLAEIDGLEVSLLCRERCGSGGTQQQCLRGCPGFPADAEKDGTASIDANDLELALLEFWDPELICYQDKLVAGGAQVAVVKPQPACTDGPDCSAVPTPQECADGDQDGLAQWQETLAGTSDSEANRTCASGGDCGFTENCAFTFGLGRMLCAPRTCSERGCTAFHLAQVALNEHEFIVHLYYDYSPVPATVLDLRLTYDHQNLVLVDNRPLASLTEQGKELSTHHLDDGALRLVVLGGPESTPIPTGPIVELVFSRSRTVTNSFIKFSTEDYYQRLAMAPEQGLAQEELTDDLLWNGGVGLTTSAGGTNKLLLSYTFDNARKPLAVNHAPQAARLCELLGSECATTNKSLISRLEMLQAGRVLGAERIDGVTGKGVYLNGSQGHLRMPVANTDSNERSFSLSGWFYAEGNWDNEQAFAPQLLFSHNTSLEETAFGLLVQPEGADTALLQWFTGQYDSVESSTKAVVAQLPLRTWTHVGLTYDDETKAVEIFVNGQEAYATSMPQGLQCPQVTPKFALFTEGDKRFGGVGGEVVYYDSPNNGPYAIVRMDPQGVAVEQVLANPPFQYRDPDYQQLQERLVYVSNESDGFEVWMSKTDGSDRTQLTEGFGNTDLAVFARRPRWNDKGDAIVFESNVFDVETNDNSERVYQLYRIPMDPNADGGPAVDISRGDGGKVERLFYDQTAIEEHRLADSDDHQSGATWLDADQLLYTQSSTDYKTQSVYRLRFVGTTGTSKVPLRFSDEAISQKVRLLDAVHIQSPVEDRALVRRQWSGLGAADQYAIHITHSDVVEVTAVHQPNGYDPMCWDGDGNGHLDVETEDTDQDGLGTEEDCYPSEVHDLYLSYNFVALRHHAIAAQAGAGIVEALGGVRKELEVTDEYPSTGVTVRLDIHSPYNNAPLAAGAELVKLVFEPLEYGGEEPLDEGLALQMRSSQTALYIARVSDSKPLARRVSLQGKLDDVISGRFAPDGKRVVLAGVKDARPTVVRARIDAISEFEPIAAMDVQRLTATQERVEGLDWKKTERYYACNWVGAYRDRDTGVYRHGFRGGLDELRLYNYVREAAGLHSDAARGLERLREENRDGELASRLPACGVSDSDCPPYHLCQHGQCTMVHCDPTVPTSCIDKAGRGLCTVRPTSVEQSEQGYDWVCSTECSVDTECFRQDCLNGPCRFCDAQTRSCIECTTDGDEAVGCPDRNSYSCADGSCVSECLSFENNQSLYLCHSPFEYCSRGRCQLTDWQWPDLAPARLSGANEMLFAGASAEQVYATTVVSPFIPIVVTAFGIGDYLHGPQIQVEGKLGNGGEWFEIGRFEAEPEEKDYKLQAWRRFDMLRLRLVVPPHDNLSAGATGWLKATNPFCQHSGDGPSPCVHKAPGSRYVLGYPASVPYESVMAAQGTVLDEKWRYLRPGSPGAIVTKLLVQGGGLNLSSDEHPNLICSYEGTDRPVESGTQRRREMFFGPNEISNLHDCTREEVNCEGLEPFTQGGGSWGVLNCPFADPQGDVAAIVVPVVLTAPSAPDGVTETANGCKYGDGEQCYEWLSDASFDPYNQEAVLFNVIDFEEFASFGDDEGFTVVEAGP